MRVLLFTLEYPPFKGGIANYNNHLIKEWPEPGNIFVLHNNKNKLLSFPFWPHWLPALWYLWRAVRKYKIDYVITDHILPLGTITWFLSKISRIKYCVILHGMDWHFGQRVPRKRKLTKKILKSAQQIIGNSSFVIETIGQALPDLPKSKLQVVNPGITPTYSRNDDIKEASLKINSTFDLNGKYVLFSLGRLVKRKGFDNTIRALPRVLERSPNTSYFIAGAGSEEEYLKELVREEKEADLQSKVIFLGKVSEAEKWAWLNICDVFVMPARDIDGDVEGFGIVYLEANLAGKPVLAGRSGGVVDAVGDQKSGVIVDPESFEAIADGILELKNPVLRQKMGQYGMKRAAEDFQWVRQIDKIYKIINRY